MSESTQQFDRVEAKRREQTPQVFARLAIVGLFISLWFVLWLARIPMPFPFLVVLLVEAIFFVAYWRIVCGLRSVRAIDWSHSGMLAAEIVFHTTMVHFLGGLSWLGAFAYVFGLIFSNTFLDLRRGFLYTAGASGAFVALIVLEATGVVPHYVFLEQGALRYADPRLVITTAIAGAGVFFSIYLWVNWVGHQLRQERDGAVSAQDDLLVARGDLQRANEGLEERVSLRTAELELANAALRASETQFRGLAETISAAVFIYQGERMRYVNSAAEALTGYSRDEILKMNFWDVILPELRELVKERGLARQRGDDVPAGYEVKILRKDGEERWVDFTSGAIEMEGQPAVLGTAFDITERKRAEDALQNLRRQNELLLNSAGEGIYGLDLEGNTTFVNPAAARMIGWEVEEIIGKSQHGILHHSRADGSAYPREECPIYAAFKDGSVHHVSDEVFWRKDGSSFAVEYISTPIRGESGEPIGAVVTFRDITERLRAEEALRESEAKYRSIFDHVQDIFYQTDAAGTIIEINPAVERFGYSREELIGTSVLDIYEDPEKRLAFVQAVLEEGTVSDYEMRLRRKDGRGVDMSVSARAVLNADGTLEGFEGSIRDITERKRAEEALRRQAQLDPLTGLLNRRAGRGALEERLTHAKGAGGVGFTLLVLDVDRFKLINDNYSHETGDAALIRLANLLARLTGERGVVCRMGGDEFEIGLEDMGLVEAQAFGEEIRAELHKALAASHPLQFPQFTVSIGVACFPQDGDTVVGLGRRADHAMYAAKAIGGDATRAWRHIAVDEAA